MADSSNPLFKHFRQPQLHIKLPSNGKWYPSGALEPSVTGEYPVYAMTARDELTLKTPDALLNGQSTVDVIHSCVPNIKNAWGMPAVDLDAVLIAIRQATYGNALEFVSLCPHCQQKNENAVDLGILAERITCPDFSRTVSVDGLEIFIKPQNYKQFNQAGIENYEQQRIIQLVGDKTMEEEEKLARFDQLFKKLLNLTVEQVTKSVAAIRVDDTTVEDSTQIDEFFRNCNKTVWEAVKSRLEEIGEQNPLKKIPVTCEHETCAKPYETPLLFEMSNFFV
jgi:hypothetical protein